MSHIAITPRIETESWLKPAIIQPLEGSIFLTNSSDHPVRICKAMHIADIRDTEAFELPKQPSFVTNKHHEQDTFQFTNFSQVQEEHDKYLHLIQVDPDQILTEEDRQIFHNLHERFAHNSLKVPIQTFIFFCLSNTIKTDNNYLFIFKLFNYLSFVNFLSW